jgi:hypothetical protein
MRRIVLFVLVVICCPWANGQKQTPADPYGLTAFGFEQKLESRPLITPAREPAQSRACGAGVYLREETATVNNKVKKIKVVIVYFLPNPNTLSTFDDYDIDKMKPYPADELTNLPPGVSSLTFFWPPRLRTLQSVLLMRAEKVDDGLFERAMNFHAQIAVQEDDSPSILWKFDDFIPGVGRREPVLLKISFPQGAKKCIEGK